MSSSPQTASGNIHTVYKWLVPVSNDLDMFELPVGSEILSVGVVDKNTLTGKGAFYLWAKVREPLLEPAPTATYPLFCAGTGHAIPANIGPFIGTVQDGPYVWHVFHRYQP